MKSDLGQLIWAVIRFNGVLATGLSYDRAFKVAQNNQGVVVTAGAARRIATDH